ncbi:hypothetical protein PG984_009890 [Apiospora sp. TS-2023a]
MQLQWTRDPPRTREELYRFQAGHPSWKIGAAWCAAYFARFVVLDTDHEKAGDVLVTLWEITVETEMLQRELEDEKRLDRIDKGVQKLEQMKAELENTLQSTIDEAVGEAVARHLLQRGRTGQMFESACEYSSVDIPGGGRTTHDGSSQTVSAEVDMYQAPVVLTDEESGGTSLEPKSSKDSDSCDSGFKTQLDYYA